MVDFLIVGQGLAGTVVAHTLQNAGKSIYVIHHPENSCASRVAAGLYNPVTGKRMVQTWKADQLFPKLISFYKSLESKLNADFLHEMPIYKPFNSLEEKKHFTSNKDFPSRFVNLFSDDERFCGMVHNPFGGFETLQSGYLDTNRLLDASLAFFKQQDLIFFDIFKYHDLVLKEDYVEWNLLKFRKVIFCEGIGSLQNPFFSWLPLIPNKGEILGIQLSDFATDTIFNRSAFILPDKEHLFKAGSTYEWEFADENISSEGRAVIEYKLQKLLKKPYMVVQHKSGLRPTVKDRSPLIGFHPQFKTLGIFNGLGTKGVSLAPFLAEEFLHYINDLKDLDIEINIKRFYPLF